LCGRRTNLPIPVRPRTGLITYDAKDPESKFPPIELPRLDLVTEFLWGHLQTKGGEEGFASQTQIGSTFRF